MGVQVSQEESMHSCFFFSDYRSTRMVNKTSWFQARCVLSSVSVKEEVEGRARRCLRKTTPLAHGSDAPYFRDGWQKLYVLKKSCIKVCFSWFAIFRLSWWRTTKGQEMKRERFNQAGNSGTLEGDIKQFGFFLLGYVSPQHHVNKTGNSRDSFSISTWYCVSLRFFP